MKTYQKHIISLLVLAGCAAGNVAQAAISLDRTRAIYVGDAKSISLNITNENKENPFLAQSWLEDKDHKKITSPLVVLPPLQRVEPGEHSVVRVTKTPQAEALPQDRETLFYFNLREIPPKSKKVNVMQLALQTQIKLFYRPKAIVPKKGTVVQEQLVINKAGNSLTVNNPTPYYITLSSVASDSNKVGGKSLSNFKGVMLSPKSTDKIVLQAAAPDSFVITYINDYGGHPELRFACHGGNDCRAEPEKK